MLLGSGELGKEVAIAGKRLGCKVIACDRYEEAPAMQVADLAIVLDMNNHNSLQKTIRDYKPDVVIPEIEALAVEALKDIEKEGINVIPNARATAITMNRDQIRNLAAEKLAIKTANYGYASNIEELKEVSKKVGFPLLVKPVMSSSGKGQSLIKDKNDLEKAWDLAIKEARGDSKQVIIEEYINFDLEITLLTIKQSNHQTIFCPPIGHEQKGGDYQCSWQPQKLSFDQLKEAKSIAKKVTNELGGIGLFGVEFFIRGEEVIFSELSPRPHDTGLVTLISQNLNEFELHLRAILGLPIPSIECVSPSASRVILSQESFAKVAYKGIEKALEIQNSKIMIFGKPNTKKGRRMGVSLAQGKTLEEARFKADKSAKCIQIFEAKEAQS
ncbi:Phosphoribosylglycinamide formyltransferase 2 [Prochlorococcus marinus str. LG]|nr:Phosphoribosylglycinamide formyltransferase 2 [Prochlorococcus marinus str. LG]